MVLGHSLRLMEVLGGSWSVVEVLGGSSVSLSSSSSTGSTGFKCSMLQNISSASVSNLSF